MCTEKDHNPNGKPSRRRNRKRTATEVINQAIHENQLGLHLLYVLACLLVIVGSIVILTGVFTKSAIVTIAGCVASALFIPAMSYARIIRRENVALRLLEAPLSRTDTAKETAEVIRDYFLSVSNDHSWKRNPSD